MQNESRWELWAIVGLLAVAFLVLIGGVFVARQDAASAVPPTTHQTPRTCFDREDWGTQVSPALRPCARIVRLYEDGSLKIRVSDANGTIRYSVGVGNPQD